MADAKAFNVNGTSYTIIDETARNNASTGITEAERNRQSLTGTYAGQSLTAVLASEIGSGTVYDALHTRVSRANFAGLRVGDYIDVPLTEYSGLTTSQSVRFLLAHIDPYYQCGDTAKGHHLAFVASAPIPVAGSMVTNGSYIMWRTTADNNGTADEKHPYLCSQLKEWETAFEACLPAGLSKYLLTQRTLLPERYSSGGTVTDDTSWSWEDIGKVWSLSEMEVYGCCAKSNPSFNVGMDCQFDLFHGSKQRINGSRIHWWLRSVGSGSSSAVCNVGNSGNAASSSATSTYILPRPGFLLG